jgi:glycerophosphoryl diester phosphodiesterase
MTTSPHPLVLGHRGAAAHAAENTLGAYSLAVAQNADGIELDIRLTADSVMVLHHDPDVPEIGTIVRRTFAELRAAAPHVPTPDEMLAVTGDLLIDVEIKNDPRQPDHDPHHAAADLVVEWIQQHGLHWRTFVSSFNPETMDRVRHLDPTITTGQLLAGGDVPELAAGIAERGHTWVLPWDHMLGIEPAVQMGAAHAAGLKVMVWTVDDPARMRQLAAAGIDGIITNDPALAVDALADQAAEPGVTLSDSPGAEAPGHESGGEPEPT